MPSNYRQGNRFYNKIGFVFVNYEYLYRKKIRQFLFTLAIFKMYVLTQYHWNIGL